MTKMNPRPLLGIGINQIQAIRDALSWSIGGLALPILSGKVMLEWLAVQGLENQTTETADSLPVKIIVDAVDRYRSKSLGMETFVISSSQCSPDAKPIGRDRSGTAWSEGAAFCISSAFVRVLGAWEQFEMDVLKALLYYRPHGRNFGHLDDHMEETVELDIVTEEPEVKGDVEYYTKPAIWTWIRPSAENREERRKIFSRVYDFDMTHGADTERKNNKALRKSWYEKRNIVAHGRACVKITLKEFLDVDVYVHKAMMHLATLCKDQQKLII